jgi:hypothetical protein
LICESETAYVIYATHFFLERRRWSQRKGGPQWWRHGGCDGRSSRYALSFSPYSYLPLSCSEPSFTRVHGISITAAKREEVKKKREEAGKK